VRNEGFTLLELLVVLAVIAMAAVIAIPPLGAGGDRAKARAAVRSVVSGLRATRSAALAGHADPRLVIDVNARTIRVPGEGRARQLPMELELGLTTARSELEGDGVGGVRFFADGSSTGARIRVGARSTLWLVDVDWLTGSVASLEVEDPSDPAIDDVRAAWQDVSSR
jgi:general secretion pathway protein H